MSECPLWLIFALCGFSFGLGIWGGVAVGSQVGLKNLQAEAVRRGFASYVVEKDSNKPVFKWKGGIGANHATDK